MKRYGICFLLFAVLAVVCFGAGFAMSAVSERQGNAISNTTYFTEEVTDEPYYQKAEESTKAEPEQVVINQRIVEPAVERPLERYYLVSETGYLLVFADDQSTICLYTHIPITDFPEKEQERLREGIWFPSMMEIFHYLESYTS